MNLSKLRSTRASQGLSQSDLARSVGVSLATYQRIESDPDRTSIRRARLIAANLGVNVQDLFFGQDPCTEQDAKCRVS